MDLFNKSAKPCEGWLEMHLTIGMTNASPEFFTARSINNLVALVPVLWLSSYPVKWLVFRGIQLKRKNKISTPVVC